MNSGTESAENVFSVLKVVFFRKCMANDDISEPPRRADSKGPIFINLTHPTSHPYPPAPPQLKGLTLGVNAVWHNNFDRGVRRGHRGGCGH